MNTFVSSTALVPVQSHALIPAPPAPQNDPECWEYWLPRWIAMKRTTTKAVYAAEIKKFLDFIGWKPISTLQVTDIEEYQQLQISRKQAANTVGRKVATVCSLCSYIYKRNPRVMPVNPGAGVERIKPSNELAARILNEAEVLRMFDRTANKRDYALLRVLYNAGARISEACDLRWADIEWSDKEAALTLRGKGGKIRTVTVYGAAVEALRAIMPAEGYEPSAHVFRTCHGPLSRIYAVQVIRRAAKRAGIKKAVSPHWLRHAAATHALDRGATLVLVSRTLGHANLAVTGRYLHTQKGDSMGKFHAI